MVLEFSTHGRHPPDEEPQAAAETIQFTNNYPHLPPNYICLGHYAHWIEQTNLNKT